MWLPVRFYKESREFTKGYSNWWYVRHLPRAVYVFYIREPWRCRKGCF